MNKIRQLVKDILSEGCTDAVGAICNSIAGEAARQQSEIDRLKEAVKCAISSIEQNLLQGKGADPQTERDMLLAYLGDVLKPAQEAQG